jgi:putative FmdB family regulatory protein
MRYEYKCEDCVKTVEVSKPVSQIDRPEKCETCGKDMQRQITSSAFHLKGTGWYKTDYAKKR